MYWYFDTVRTKGTKIRIIWSGSLPIRYSPVWCLGTAILAQVPEVENVIHAVLTKHMEPLSHDHLFLATSS